MTDRSREEILGLLDGFELVPPGLVWAPQWRPDAGDTSAEPQRSSVLAAVGQTTTGQTATGSGGR